VCQNCRRKMDTQASKEEHEERNPSQVLDCTTQHASVTQPVFEQSKTKVSNTGEDDNASKENFERVKVEPVNLGGKTQKKVVDD
jgi:hypothetical protein